MWRRSSSSPEEPLDTRRGQGIDRRKFLTGAALTVGTAAAGSAVAACGAAGSQAADLKVDGVEPFYGARQAGIATEQQDRLLFATFDVTAPGRDKLVHLLREWTHAAAAMTAGSDIGPVDNPDAPPADTGEATGLDPARLTITFGFGPTLFDQGGTDRFGIAHERPAALVDLPVFAGDALEPGRCGGDLCVQACSNDPQMAFHAVRNLTRIARGTALLRWSQQGFGRTSSTTPSQVTPRNLMGFKDGTNNVRAGEDPFDSTVWVAAGDDPAWMRDGSYLVTRRIRMLIEVWDRSTLQDQEQTIGRTKVEGAPLGAERETDPIDLDLRDGDGEPVTPVDAHVRLANQNATGMFMLRRGYSFTDGVDLRTGQLDSGLFFIAYQRDPRAQFVPVQRALATDALNEYIKHVGSAIFAVPPGTGEGGFVGETLFG